MTRTVTSAIVQVAWTGDKESMIELHEKYVAEAASAGARVMCFQELFYGPYFCQVQDTEFYSYAEAVPDGPTTKRFQELAATHEMVLVLPMYEHEQAGLLYNTAAVIDADGSYLGKYRKTHIPQVKGFWEKFYFRPGNLGYPVFETAVGTVGVYICYDRHFPEGWRALALGGAELVFNPSATFKGLSDHIWNLEQVGAAIANGIFIGTNNRVGTEPSFGNHVFYGSSYFCNPRGEILAQGGDQDDELVVAELDLDQIREVRDTWQFFRDRRPETYQHCARQP